ncbi:ABC transporter substrate-binding protein [Desulfonatronum thiodismutans]|uniref:ABC transporter substrate-binding protein n=1 Tax=Desulfonatronum thiodismutans TaxID=159290 RepID=UPI0004ABEE2D|nr:ABC transporter substrate-binding protein [Desulfonatronum thiodismutans]
MKTRRVLQPRVAGFRLMLWALLAISISLGMDGQVRGESLEPIRIASAFSATGPLSTQNVWSFSVVRLAARTVNSQGGVLGRPIELIELDTQSTPLGARQAALEAVRAGVTAVIGPSFSSQAMAMGPVLQEAGIPMIGTNTTAPAVTRIGEYVFRASFTDESQAMAMANFAHDHLKARTVAVLHIVDDLYSEGLSSVFVELFTALGGKSVLQLPYLLSDTDFSRQISMIKEADPDLVFLPGHARDSGMILKQARAMGLAVPFLGGDGWSALEAYPHLTPDWGDVYYASHWHSARDTEPSRAFQRILAQEFGEDASMVLISARANDFDALGLVADAIRRAGSADPKAVRDALAMTVKYPGVTGEISFQDSRDPLKPVYILRITQDAIEHVTSVEPKL